MEPTAPDDCGVEFNLLVSKSSEILQNSSATNLASIKHALALVTVHKMSSQPLFSDAELRKINQSKDICEIIELCRSHWSWKNYSLLKLIVKKSGSKEAKRELQIFQKVVIIRQKVKDLGNDWLENAKNYTEGYENIMVILDEYYDVITVHQLEKTEKFMSEIALLSSHTSKVITLQVIKPITKVVQCHNKHTYLTILTNDELNNWSSFGKIYVVIKKMAKCKISARPIRSSIVTSDKRPKAFK